MKNYVQALVGLLLVPSTVYPKESNLGILKNHVGKLAIVAVAAGHISLRKLNDSYKEMTDTAYGKAKKIVVEKLLVPAVHSLERIKDEGISRNELITACGMMSAMAALTYHLKLHTLDPEIIIAILRKDSECIRKNLALVGTISLLGIVSLLHYLEGLNLPYMQRFLHSLTEHQRWEIYSCDHMTTIVDRAHEDPEALKKHERLQQLLHKGQRELLEKAIQEHVLEQDPMSLLDDLEDY